MGQDTEFRELLGMQGGPIIGAQTPELQEMEKEPTAPGHTSILQASNSQLVSECHQLLSTLFRVLPLTLPTFSVFPLIFPLPSLVLPAPSSPPPPS